MHNLLEDLLFTVKTKTGVTVKMHLPGLYEALWRGEIISFSHLQQHQEHAWHAFLTQLAAMLLKRFPEEDYSAASWRKKLRCLTPEFSEDEPWQLIVEDLSKPAFFQPPVPERSLKEFESDIVCPDQLDLLITATNHDVKRQRIYSPDLDHWIYALITLQTMQGFSGRDNYGISRMNSGYGNRPCVSMLTSWNPGERLQRDSQVLLGCYNDPDSNFSELFDPSGAGCPLLWLLPWDGKTGLVFDQSLDLYFLEICRRIRFSSEGGLKVYRKSSGPRFEKEVTKSRKGVLGDPWTPLESDKEDVKSVSISSEGFSYKISRTLLFKSKQEQAPCQQAHSKDPLTALLWMQALVRGQGKTEGWHERAITIPGRIIQKRRTPLFEEKLALLSTRFVDTAKAVEEALKNAALVFLQFAPEKVNYQDERIDPWMKKMKLKINDQFFCFLWSARKNQVEMSEGEGINSDDRVDRWREWLMKTAKELLEQLFQSTYIHNIRYYKACQKSNARFYGMCKKLK